MKALKKFEEKPEVRIYNLGTGIGYSVLDVLHAYEEACGKTLPYEINHEELETLQHAIVMRQKQKKN